MKEKEGLLTLFLIRKEGVCLDSGVVVVGGGGFVMLQWDRMWCPFLFHPLFPDSGCDMISIVISYTKLFLCFVAQFARNFSSLFILFYYYVFC